MDRRSFLKTGVGAASLTLAAPYIARSSATTLRFALGEMLASTPDDLPALEIAIGPEGGWALAEEALFDTSGWRAVSLGPRILRAETAAIAALAVVSSLLD